MIPDYLIIRIHKYFYNRCFDNYKYETRHNNNNNCDNSNNNNRLKVST